MSDTDTAYGQQDPADSVGPFNPVLFAILQALARIATIKIVKVMAVDTGTHTVDVQIAVNQLDGQLNATPHGTIFGIPYIFAMGGTNAFEVDPTVGDMGVMAVCDRDISGIKNTKSIANPGSSRKFSPSDGIYLFAVPGLNGDPTQTFKWTSGGGFNITDSFGNVLQGNNAGISINGVVFNRSGQVAGNLLVTGALQLGGSIEALAGGEYGGDISTSGHFFGANFSIGSGGTLVSLLGHEHAALNAPPIPGH